MGSHIGHCRWCRASISWAMNERTNRRLPLDFIPSDDGTVIKTGRVSFDGTPLVEVYHAPTDALIAGGMGATRYTNHLATCSKKRKAKQ